MSGWVIIVALAGAVLLGMWPWLRRDMGALQFVGAALLLGLAGYSWSGKPSMAGEPKTAEDARARPDTDFAQLRRDLFPQFDRSGSALSLAETMNRMGRSDAAVTMLRGELDKSPRSMVLWLGLADALVQHGGGMLTPAAQLAFEKAANVAPDHPAPHFFYAVALLRMGQFDQAEQFLQRVLALPQTNDKWRELVGRARMAIAQMRSAAPAGPQATQ